MSGTIQDVVNSIQTTVDAITGIRSAPNYPPNQLTGMVLTAVTYPASGTIRALSAGWMQELHTVNIDLILPAKDLTRDMIILNPFLRSVPNAIIKAPTFGGNASTFDSLSYSYILVEDGGIQYRGYRFVISGIKIQPATT
jgi:hypothetical protein